MDRDVRGEASFGEWLSRRRKALGLTQQQLAQRINCSASALRKIEAEQRRPSAQIVEKLGEILNIPTHEQANLLKFARGDWKSLPDASQVDLPWQVSSPRINLPAPLTSLIGRETQVAAVREYLLKKENRLITLVGSPGIGKTRLSIETARAVQDQFSDGEFFIPLASLDDPSLLASTIVQALGYVEAKNLPAAQYLKAGISTKQILLVLDNCEHLIEAVASLVSDLLTACPRLKVLATSRESFRLTGEWLYPVQTLPVPEKGMHYDEASASSFPALILFSERARAVKPDFVLTADNLDAVSSICAKLDGLPLAIELIAARIRLFSPQALLERLDDQFILAADGIRTDVPHQKTMETAIGWSFNLLSGSEQEFFACLSVFSGKFTLTDAEHIFSEAFTGKSISVLITALLDKSLVLRASSSETGSEEFFTMLATIQQFALDRLRQHGKEIEMRNRHLAHFIKLAEQSDKQVRQSDQIEWLHRLDTMRDNFRSGLEWVIKTGQTQAALLLVRKLGWYWFIRSNHAEGRRWLHRILEMPDTHSYPEAHSEALIQLAYHTFLQITPREAKPYAQQGLSIARTHADKHNIGRALTVLGLILTSEKDFTAAASALEESRALLDEVRDDWWYAQSIFAIGYAARWQDQLQKALALEQEALAVFSHMGDRYFKCVVLSEIGAIHNRLANVKEGVAALQEALVLAQQLGSKYEIATVLRRLANSARIAGKPERSVLLYWGARNIYDSLGAFQPEDVTAFEAELAQCRAKLDDAGYTAAVEKGQILPDEDVIALALGKVLS